MLESRFAEGNKLLRSISILGYEERKPLQNAGEGKAKTKCERTPAEERS